MPDGVSSLRPSRTAETLRIPLEDINRITERIIGLAIEVHRHLGPGLLESNYEAALSIELRDNGLPFSRQVDEFLRGGIEARNQARGSSPRRTNL